jgi:DNA primase
MKITEVLKKVSDVYHNNIWKYPEVLNYLIVERGLNENMIKKFRLGFAKGNVVNHIAKEEGWYSIAMESSVLTKNDNDFFEGYITFPVFYHDNYLNIYGRSFNRRIPHIMLTGYKKSCVYNKEALDEEAVIIVESCIDVVTLIQNGFNSCGIFGTSISKDMRECFKDKVCYILLDKDSAGISGATNVANILYNIASKVFILEFPGNSSTKMDVNKYFLTTKLASKRLRFLLKNSVPFIGPPFTVPQKIKKEKKEIINKLNNKVNIVELAKDLFKGEDYVDKGNGLWIRCPHHSDGQERNRSLWVGGNKNIFYCFGCHVGGGPVKLITWHFHLNFNEAIEWLLDYRE